MSNPLLTSFDQVPFDAIKDEHFKPAFDAALSDARKEIDAIAQNPEVATFENTIAALDYSGEHLGRLSSVFFNLNSAETNPQIQALAQDISPLLSAFSNDVTLNEELFARINSVWNQRASLDLNAEENRLLEKTHKSFSRNGALLDEASKDRLREIDGLLSRLQLQFGENVLAETNAYQLHITDEANLEGLPESLRQMAAAIAGQRELDGWVFTLDYPSYVPFMKYAKNRALRKEMAMAFGKRGFQDNDHDNKKVLLEIVGLREERARLLGFGNHAEFVLAERMAEKPATVQSFLEELLSKALPAAQKDLKALQDLAKEQDQIETLERWDASFYSEQLKQARFSFDEQAVKPYFPLQQVLEGVFTIAGKLFDLHFNLDKVIPTYHEEVDCYRVYDGEGNFVALFYSDFHPREGKRPGAWMTSYKSQSRKDGENRRPHISIVCNFSRATESAPALLSFDEVLTLFHEFGHALHGMLADTTFPGLSGTSVYWDFVELPSQIMENWCYEKEALALFAKHYETGEALPMEEVQKIKAMGSFLEGLATARQLSFGLLDMAWHTTEHASIEDVKTFETAAMEKASLYPPVAEACMSTAFSHIFQGGYSAGYYSYKWAEVLDADAFEAFLEAGIFDQATADSFKENILSKGGTQAPMELYRKFRGREPRQEALLKRAGLR
ncbi:M3 family metallopeptidase [Aureicoccus marinus]|uniref:Peptidase M3 n=1 Tax=Aureicoccus marinus TaxID=754435 RepID=A0A2S7T3B4_9FLAO|nr:M3 family metallopeptidase [Aureicoccus marinus]PQJ14393.1 peptidase M3 [Aureicoccus marinus]